MHRLLGHTCGKIANCLPISHIYLKQNSNQACFFCKQRHAQLIVAVKTINRSSFSTYANSDILVLNGVKKVKKTRKSKQKYTELFEVGDKASNLKKILIKNMNASHIDLLTQKREAVSGKDVSLEEGEYFTDTRLKFSQCDSKEDVTDTNHSEFLDGNMETINHGNVLEGSAELAHDSDILDDLDQKEKSMLYLLTAGPSMPDNQSSSDKSAPKKKKSPRSKNSPRKSEDKSSSKLSEEITKKIEEPLDVKFESMKRIEREKNFNASLLSFIETSVSCQLLNRAFYTVLKYHQDYKNVSKRNPNTPRVPVSNPKIFSTLAHGFASKHNLVKVKELMRIFSELGIAPTPQLLSACFECIGRLPRTPELDDELHQLSEWLKRDGLSFNHLFTETMYVNDQKEQVLEAVRRLEPDFEIRSPTPDMNYSCQLLDHFNTGERNFRSPSENLFTPKSLRKLALEQLKIESNITVTIQSVESVEETPEVLKCREKLKSLKTLWMEDIKNGITREISMVQLKNDKFNSNFQMNLYPYLRVLDVESYAELIMQEVEKLIEGSETYSNSLNFLFKEIGNQVRLRYLIKHKKQTGILKKQFSLYKTYCDWYLKPDSSSSNTRQKWQQLVHEASSSGPDVTIPEKYWNNVILHGIGRVLYNVITNDIKVDGNILKDSKGPPQIEPAFFVLFRTHGVRSVQEIKPHPVLSRLSRASRPKDLRFDATLVPMVSPPLPWSTISSGGYILAKADLIRLPQFSSNQWHRLEQTPAQEMYPSFDALNQLGSIPWKVNKPVLDIILHVFNNGGSHKLDIPMPPSACPVPDPIPRNATTEERYAAAKQRFLLARKRSEMHSLRCDALYRLSLANHYRDRIFWLPHNMDFRGRVYPVAPLLNHLGSDMARSMLFFAKGEPLGPKGLDWLKIHCINLTGLKKRDAVKDRLDYANEILPDIIDSADNPLNGKQWWAESETPWQTLACCMTIRDAINSGDPESFICHFPVHQDGSCNGLQHYAALGRDLAGAISVNLTPAEVPQDVYSCVAALVEREREKDAERGLDTAIALKGFVKRKVIKQTVMTTVYGVTRFGARLQIAKQLKDIDDFPSDSVWQASMYLVGKTFYCLQEMFTSTKHIQDWFTECARLISQAGQPVEWITPLGLPIIQPYMRSAKQSMTSHPTSASIQPNFGVDFLERPNIMRQKNAFPPNFIHSLDSCHMMLTSLHCERKHITFVSVHDCFWTHPNTIDIMNKVCREQFVNLHSLPILESLSEHLVKTFAYENVDTPGVKDTRTLVKQNFNKTLRSVPPKGELDIQQVKESVYFFS